MPYYYDDADYGYDEEPSEADYDYYEDGDGEEALTAAERNPSLR